MDDKQILDAIDGLRGSIENRAEAVTGKVERATGLVDKVKDNIAYILGLPAAVTGAFSFMLDSSTGEAALVHQIAQLEEAVADLKAEGDLLGGGGKNFTLDLSGAPGGSLTPILAGAALLLIVASLFWYQARRRR
jgi:hypothetical protein|tara:strand:- start:62 stop:466 length:405 start_codon:yes stop_codon:yes gene_type:complete